MPTDYLNSIMDVYNKENGSGYCGLGLYELRIPVGKRRVYGDLPELLATRHEKGR